jgi:hypothetical protein
MYGALPSMAPQDGLLSKVMRELGQIPNEQAKWILLDGDLDANWIESMNSVRTQTQEPCESFEACLLQGGED